MRESIMLGAATGAGAGALVGANVEGRHSESSLTGAAIGAVVGGIASYIIHNGLESRDANVRKETLFNLDKFNVSHPKESSESDYMVSQPSVETQCFDSEIRGNKLVQAHCESTIVEKPEWVPAKRKSNGK